MERKNVLNVFRGSFLMLCLSAFALHAQGGTGRITGKVVEGTTESPLVGASVTLVGTNLGATTDRQGYYIINNVPAGTQSVSVRYIGYEKATKSVIVAAGEAAKENFELRAAALSLGTVDITAAHVASSQATALNTQKEATNIKNVIASDLIGSFPDMNAADALSRVPSLSITRDQGEGRFVIIRGIDPKYNSTTINGQKQPTGERAARTAQLDQIPSEIIETIEVSKALTADMDADAIGGSINLITKEPRDAPTFSLTSAYGVNAQKVPTREGGEPNLRRLSGVAGNSFNKGRFAYLLAGSYYDNVYKNDTQQATAATDAATINANIAAGQALSDGTLTWQQRDYEEHRTRTGLTGSFLFKPSLGNKYFVKTTYTQLVDFEYRWSYIERYSDFQKRKELKYRKLTEKTPNISIGGENIRPSGVKLDYSANYIKAIYDRPNEYTNFRFLRRFTDKTLATPRKGTGFPDTAGYVFDNVDIRTELNYDKNQIYLANLLLPYSSQSIRGNVKFGVKAARKHRESNVDLNQLRRASTQYPSAIFLPGGPNTTATVPLWTQFVAPQAAVIWTQGITNPANVSQNYEAIEDVTAGYAMSDMWLSPRLLFVPGVRVEKTSSNYLSALPGSVRAKNDYSNVLPGANLRFNLSDNTNFRVAVTRAISRPNYSDLVPVDYQPDATTRILGNPALKPAQATNFDLMYEHFDSRLAGVFSAGFFAKKLTNPVEVYNTVSGTVTTTQPRNSGDGTIKGFEVAILQNLARIGLPSFGINANYTYADSKIKELVSNRERTMVGQSKHLASASLNYENYGFSGQLSYQFKGKQIEASGTSDISDTYEADYTRYDISLSKKLKNNTSIFFQGNNLNDAPLHFYFANPVTKKPFDVQVEHYGPSYQMGLKWSL
jgi:TonB-dependent receptor